MLIDFHSHILPHADHGSDSIETSIKQLKMLKEVGVQKIVATPHFYPQVHSVEAFISMRERCASKLKEALENGFPEIILGAEVLVCSGLDRMEGIKKLCISGTNTLLLEMPLTSKWHEGLYETVYNIGQMDFDIVLAHIDRYPLDNIMRIIEETGASAQLNASACASFKGRRKAHAAIESGCVVALGSDIHMAEKNDAKNFARFIKWASDDIENIFEKTETLLAGAQIL